jgi:AraC-like DNA-binding protein
MSIGPFYTHLFWVLQRVVEPEFLDTMSFVDGNTTLWFVEKGSVRIEYDDGASQALSGQWLFRRHQQGHQVIAPGTRLLSIKFALRLWDHRPYYPCKKERVFGGNEYPNLLRSARQLQKFCGSSVWKRDINMGLSLDSASRRFRMESAFQSMLSQYVDTMNALNEPSNDYRIDDPRVVEALNIIESHPFRLKFQEKTVSQNVGLSVSQLNRVFRQATGDTVYAYYEQRRRRLAMDLLSQSEYPIKEVAYSLGFSSPAHFSNWFRQRYQLTPSAFRDNLQGSA